MLSVRHTMRPVLFRQKTVTRRDGWWERKNGTRQLQPGQRLRLCDQTMGLKGRSPIVVGTVRVVSVGREPLSDISDADVAREGFPHMGADAFIEFYTRTFKANPEMVLTRIEWAYDLEQPDLMQVIPALDAVGNLPPGAYPNAVGAAEVHRGDGGSVWVDANGGQHNTYHQACWGSW